MVAEIISVGTEILLGDIINTNAQYIAKKLSHIGIEVYYQTVVGDNYDRLKGALNVAFDRSDIVVLSGGLGPTKDDLTKELVADYFGKELVFNQKVYDNVEKRGFEFGLKVISESIKKQAYVPKDALIVHNEWGTAPGIILAKDGKAALMLPGPPSEMEPLFDQCCELFLNKLSNQVFVSMNLRLKGPKEAPGSEIGEAPVADKISAFLDYTNPTVATYAKPDGCIIRVTANAPTREEALERILPVIRDLTDILAPVIKEVYES
ncbi:MAG: molybdopterin-binding protein [Lachnospiraceae bacterium]|nr:molybdopterin-binding protein [Lachnospiraceae bacterium]